MVILGIDPGLNATGYGVISVQAGQLQVVDAGAIRPSPRQPLGARLSRLYEALGKIMTAHQPSVAVLEALYTHHEYLTTASLMAHARGAVCLALAHHQVPQVDYLPTRIKKALTGNGSASKEQVARMVGTWLGRDASAWSMDTTDALALAIAHAHIIEHSNRGTISSATSGSLAAPPAELGLHVRPDVRFAPAWLRSLGARSSLVPRYRSGHHARSASATPAARQPSPLAGRERNSR